MSITNPDAAEAAQAKLVDEQNLDKATAAADAELREHVEHGDGPESIDILVNGEWVECDPLGVGQRLRPFRKAQRAEERGDDLAAAEAVLDMIDALVDVSEDGYDARFWDSLDDETLRGAYRDLAQESGGGNGPPR